MSRTSGEGLFDDSVPRPNRLGRFVFWLFAAIQTWAQGHLMKSLMWILRLAFRCRHNQMSRVFTIKGRTYQVCFKCGEEFDVPVP